MSTATGPRAGTILEVRSASRVKRARQRTSPLTSTRHLFGPIPHALLKQASARTELYLPLTLSRSGRSQTGSLSSGCPSLSSYRPVLYTLSRDEYHADHEPASVIALPTWPPFRIHVLELPSTAIMTADPVCLASVPSQELVNSGSAWNDGCPSFSDLPVDGLTESEGHRSFLSGPGATLLRMGPVTCDRGLHSIGSFLESSRSNRARARISSLSPSLAPQPLAFAQTSFMPLLQIVSLASSMLSNFRCFLR